jgi:hypothetical protein
MFISENTNLNGFPLKKKEINKKEILCPLLLIKINLLIISFFFLYL